MAKNRAPRSLRSRLLMTIILCWVLPVLGVTLLAGVLLSRSYERSSEQELTAVASGAVEQLELRLEGLFEDSKSVSYDGVVRNSYRRFQQGGDEAEFYRTVTEYLSQSFNRNERVTAAFLSLWETPDIRPYASSRGDLGFSSQKEYREKVEPDLLRRMSETDTGILLLEYGGELYVARNLLDSRFTPYATIVLLCDREALFRSLQPVYALGEASLMLDESLLFSSDGSLRTTDSEPETGERTRLFEGEASGHRLRLFAEPTHFNFWEDVPQMRDAALAVALLALPLLVLMIFLFRRYITRPVETLIEANERLQEGERGYVIGEESDSREFQSLYDHFNLMSTELKNQFERSYREQQALQQAQVKALQSQINPHFLNNTLEIINWEARMAGDDRVGAMIEALSVMMDGALGRDGRSQIHLREELSYVDAYLYIIRQRMGERLVIEKEIDETLVEVMVPRLILQPLAENAVDHDIAHRRGGQIRLRVFREKSLLCLEVEHEGSLSEEDRAALAELLSDADSEAVPSTRVGLRNVRQRLALIYGDAASLQIGEIGPDRILASVRIPLSD